MERTADDVMTLLSGIVDPEIPVLNIVEMGIVRRVAFDDGTVRVRITPTYSGCPAMHAISAEVERRLRDGGYEGAVVEHDTEEAWTTDWMGARAREKLRRYGIAPPDRVSARGDTDSGEATTACPRCGSIETEQRSYFGSTACKALYYCEDCAEPFEVFKCV